MPDPNFPFLGVHFTRMIKGGVECGPNAVLAFAREGYRKRDVSLFDLAETLTYPGFVRMATRYWRMGMGEMWRSFSKTAFVHALQRLMPAIRSEHLMPTRAGVRLKPCCGMAPSLTISSSRSPSGSSMWETHRHRPPPPPSISLRRSSTTWWHG